jgi:hypothetical protein
MRFDSLIEVMPASLVDEVSVDGSIVVPSLLGSVEPDGISVSLNYKTPLELFFTIFVAPTGEEDSELLSLSVTAGSSVMSSKSDSS